MRQTVHARKTYFTENATLSTTRFSWARTQQHKITLSCGHKIFRSGDKFPKNYANCVDCANGKPAPGVEGIPAGVVDLTKKAVVKDPIAAKLVPQ